MNKVAPADAAQVGKTGERWVQDREPYDILIIGGGINGCGIARDAAGRGYRVLLAEQNDLSSGTSSASTKLIHGGLRYLEQYEFRLVREALKEREILWRNAPHIIWPLRFVLPHHSGLRPAWLLRLGLFLYDHMGGRRRLPATRSVNLRQDAKGQPLRDKFSRGFEYSDCWVDDARLVVLNARDAADRGADILTRTRVERVREAGDVWSVRLIDEEGASRTVQARLVVNAAGPWIDAVLGGTFNQAEKRHVRLVQGSHVVIRRKFDGSHAYIFQNEDGRVIFAIPYEEDFTLIGTTDRDFIGDPSDAAITREEIDYLRDAASAYFCEPINGDDVVWSYAGVRALFDDGSARAQEATRDYLIEAGGGKLPLVNIYGGKITTYRRLAEAALETIETFLGARGDAWTQRAALPGGEDGIEGQADLPARLQSSYPSFSTDHLRRLARLYGTRAQTILGEARVPSDLGACFGADLYAAEVHYLVAHEFARTAEDILWRRTKLGLRIPTAARDAIERFVQVARPDGTAAGG